MTIDLLNGFIGAFFDPLGVEELYISQDGGTYGVTVLTESKDRTLEERLIANELSLLDKHDSLVIDLFICPQGDYLGRPHGFKIER